MKQEVRITVIGTQLDIHPQEAVKTIEQGELCQKGETTYIIYNQEDVDSKEVIHHRIKVRGQTVELHRNGAGQQSRMVFREGESYTSSYILSGMVLALTMRTKRVEIEKGEHQWKLLLEYELLLEGQHASDNRTEVWVEEI